MAIFDQREFTTKDGRNFFVRSARSDDGESVLEFGKEVMTDSAEFLLTQPEELAFTVPQESEWLEGMAANPDNLALVAELHSSVVSQ